MKNNVLSCRIGFAVCLTALSVIAAPPVEVSFTPGNWKSNEWILVKSPRFAYTHGFVQKEDGIENECPPLSGEEIYKKHESEVYSSMVWKEKVALGQTVSSAMSFDWRMAPLIVLAPALDSSGDGAPTLGEHWEIVLYDEGLNVWHHSIRDGKPFWYRAAYGKMPFQKDTRYDLSVKVFRNGKGIKEMVVTCGDAEIGFADNGLPDSFFAGITGCEGRNRFYDFKVR